MKQLLHYYRKVWQQKPAEIFNYRHEQNNIFDRFAMKSMKTDCRSTVGHLPVEISKGTKLLLDRGAELLVKLTETQYRRSLRAQGGLEVSCVLVPNTNAYSV